MKRQEARKHVLFCIELVDKFIIKTFKPDIEKLIDFYIERWNKS